MHITRNFAFNKRINNNENKRQKIDKSDIKLTQNKGIQKSE